MSAWTFKNTAIHALTSSKSLRDFRRIVKAWTNAESSDIPSCTRGSRERISRSARAGERPLRCSINGSKLPEPWPDRKSRVIGDSEDPSPADCNLETRVRSASDFCVSDSNSAASASAALAVCDALELCREGRKNGAFSGALGASLGRLRSCGVVSEHAP